MTDPARPPAEPGATDVLLSEEQLRRVEEFVEEEEGAFNRYKGWLAVFLTGMCVSRRAPVVCANYGLSQSL